MTPCDHTNPNVQCVLPPCHGGDHWNGDRLSWPNTPVKRSMPSSSWATRVGAFGAEVGAVIFLWEKNYGVAALFFGVSALWYIATAIMEKE